MLVLLISGKKLVQVFVYFKYDHNMFKSQLILTFPTKIVPNFKYLH